LGRKNLRIILDNRGFWGRGEYGRGFWETLNPKLAR